MVGYRQSFVRVAVAVALGGWMAACGSRSTVGPPSPPDPGDTVRIMGTARLSARQLVAWFNSRQPQPAGVYAATIPLEILAQFYLEEGAAEDVRGDVAFMQSIVETGWFRFNGSIPPSANNFGGIGAADTNGSPAIFPDARTGVRAQIQHLRAYADPGALTCTVPPLHSPCVDPRFHLVVPKGKTPTWNQLGNGNWASASTYASGILLLYDEARVFNGIG